MLNLENLESVTGGDQTLIDSILREFIKITEQDLKQLQQAILNNDSKEITKVSHRVKGAASVIGAESLANLLQALEVAARKADASRYTPLLAEIENAYTTVAETIRDC